MATALHEFETDTGTEDLDSEIETPHRLKDFWYRRQRVFLGVLGMALVLGAWEASADLKLVNPVFSSKPSRDRHRGEEVLLRGRRRLSRSPR